MAKIITRYSNSAGATLPVGLTTGELAVNIVQRRMFVGGTAGTVELAGLSANTFTGLQSIQTASTTVPPLVITNTSSGDEFRFRPSNGTIQFYDASSTNVQSLEFSAAPFGTHTISLPNASTVLAGVCVQQTFLASNTFNQVTNFVDGISASGGITLNGNINGSTATFNRLVSAGAGISANGATLSGVVIAPTRPIGTNDTTVATTAFAVNNFVSRLNGITGGITLNAGTGIGITFSRVGGITISGSGFALAESVVNSFNGRTGAVQGVSSAAAGTGIFISPVGGTGAVTITNIGVQSFNGLTGAVGGVCASQANTFTAMQTFNVGISANGITVSGPGGGGRISGVSFINCISSGGGLNVGVFLNAFANNVTTRNMRFYVGDINYAQEESGSSGAEIGILSGNSSLGADFYYGNIKYNRSLSETRNYFLPDQSGTFVLDTNAVTRLNGITAGITLNAGTNVGITFSRAGGITVSVTGLASANNVVTSFNGLTGAVGGVCAAQTNTFTSIQNFNAGLSASTVTTKSIKGACADFFAIDLTNTNGNVVINSPNTVSIGDVAGTYGVGTGIAIDRPNKIINLDGGNVNIGPQGSYSMYIDNTVVRSNLVFVAPSGICAAGGITLSSPNLTGTPISTTAAIGTNTNQIATTGFVVANTANRVNGFTGGITLSAGTGIVITPGAGVLTIQATGVGDASVTSFNGRTGAVQGVSSAAAGTGIFISPVGGTGAVTITNIGVQSFWGATGAVTGASLGVNTFTGLQTFNAGISAAGGITLAGFLSGNTAQFSRLVTALAGISANGATLSGVVIAPTRPIGTNDTTIATTAFVQNEIVADTVTAFNGRTGAVQGVSILNGITGGITLNAGTNIGITFSRLGGITIDATTGGGAVSSVSGSGNGISVSPTTGAVIVRNNGVHSLNGMTSAVRITSGQGITNASVNGDITPRINYLRSGITFLGDGNALRIYNHATFINTREINKDYILVQPHPENTYLEAYTGISGATGFMYLTSIAEIAEYALSGNGGWNADYFVQGVGASGGAYRGGFTFGGIVDFYRSVFFYYPVTLYGSLTGVSGTFSSGVISNVYRPLTGGAGITFGSLSGGGQGNIHFLASEIRVGGPSTLQGITLTTVSGVTLQIRPRHNMDITPINGSVFIGSQSSGFGGLGSRPSITVQNNDTGGGQVQIAGGNLYLGTRYDGENSLPTDILFGNGNNAFTTTLTAPNTATSSKTITLPNTTGTVVVDAAANIFTALQSFTAGISASGGVTFANALSVAGSLNSTGLLNSTGGISASSGVTFNTPIVSTRLSRTSSGVFDTRTSSFSPAESDNGKVFVINITGKTTVTVTLDGLSTGWRAKFLVLGGSGVSFTSTGGTVLGTFGTGGGGLAATSEMVEVYCYGTNTYFAG